MTEADNFNEAFLTGIWGSDETKSGPGSTLAYTRHLREALPGVIRALGCKSLLDAPCGDLNWIIHTDLESIKYVGADISTDLVLSNNIKFPDREILVLDITSDALPSADIWVCRDVIFHMSFFHIYNIIFNFMRSDIKFFATTHHAQCKLNSDCQTGPTSWRRLNLTVHPFNFPEPIFTLWDSIEGYPSKWLAIWTKNQIMRWFWKSEGIVDRYSKFIGK